MGHYLLYSAGGLGPIFDTRALVDGFVPTASQSTRAYRGNSIENHGKAAGVPQKRSNFNPRGTVALQHVRSGQRRATENAGSDGAKQ